MLERLRDRAKIAFAQFQSGLGPQPTVDESEFPDDVAIISGRASIINRSGSSQSPNSTSRLSESPQSRPMGITGALGTTSPNTSPIVSDARAYNIHGNVNMSMGDVMQDLGLEYYNPPQGPSHPPQYPQYMNGAGGENGVGGMNGLGTGGMAGMNGMNGMNGSMNHGSGGMLPPHLSMDHSQQQYMMVCTSRSGCQNCDIHELSVTGSTPRISPGLCATSSPRLADARAW